MKSSEQKDITKLSFKGYKIYDYFNYCSQCEKWLPKSYKFCPICNTKLRLTRRNKPRKMKINKLKLLNFGFYFTLGLSVLLTFIAVYIKGSKFNDLPFGILLLAIFFAFFSFGFSQLFVEERLKKFLK